MMAFLDVSKIMVNCKDFLHAEWACYKQSGVMKPCSICLYAVGGQDDIPVGCNESVGSGIKELEKALSEVLDFSVDKFTPLVSNDMMIWSDGHVSLFPERKYIKAENAPIANGEISLAPPVAPPPPGKKPKPPATTEATFMNCAEQVANYMLDHLKRVGEVCLLSGNIKVLYYVLASALLIKCRITTYKQVLKSSSKGFPAVMARCTEMIEIMTQHLLNYHSDIIRSSILLDSSANDWSCTRSYEENESVSLCIQMWSFYMQGIHVDLWRYVSPKVAVDMFCNILTDTLGLIVRRYLGNKPSEARVSQMKTDVTAVFFIVSSFLFSLVPSPSFLFKGNMEESVVFPIHRRMDLLLRIAALKCASVEILAKVFRSGIPNSMYNPEGSNQKPIEIFSCPEWLTFFNCRLFPPCTKQLSSLPDGLAIYLTLNNAALKPSPDHDLILRGLLMRDCLATKLILKSLRELPMKIEKGAICNGPLCYGERCASQLSPHSVYSAIVQIINDCYGHPEKLSSVMQVSVNGAVSLELLDSKQVWNKQRPPWQHALVQLAALHVTPVVAQVLKSIPVEAPAQPAHPSQFSFRLENHISSWIRQLISGVCEVADMLPPSLIRVSEALTAVLPKHIKPLGNHVISQLVISAVYSIVNTRLSLDQLSQDGAITDSQWDMMIALGERLCSLHGGNYDEELSNMTQSLLKRCQNVTECDDDNIDDYTNEEVIDEVCRQMADDIMASVQGQHAFGVIWEFLKRNLKWMTSVLKVPDLLTPPGPAEEPVRPEPPLSWDTIPELYNPLKFYDHVFYNKFNHEYLVNFEGDWESVLNKDLWMPCSMICDIIKRRPEFHQGAHLSPAEASSVKSLKAILKSPS